MNKHALRVRFLRSLLLCAVLLLCAAAWADEKPAPGADRELDMEVGENRVLSVPGVRRVAVGNSQVLTALATDEKEVVLFARQEGSSSVHLWTDKGKPQAYEVRVLPAGLRRMREEVDRLLQGVPGARSRQVGGNIVIEGSDLSDDDKSRIAALAQRYPGILDFTGQVGWDRMVLLDVQVVELPRSRMSEFGVNWSGATQDGMQAGLVWRGGGHFGGSATLTSTLNLLAQKGEAVLLAQPQLLARSGATASFLAGGEVPYSATDGEGGSTTQFKPYGVSLRITPHVDRDGAIRSSIEVEASSIDEALSLPSGPALRTRRASTEFNVRSGQTLVLGGFLSRERSMDRHGVPVLSEIPLLGSLFSSRKTREQDTELAIFVTPTIVSNDYDGFAQSVQQKQQVLHEAFPEPTRLMPLPAANARQGWSSPQSAGSQWRTAPSNHDLHDTRSID